MEIVSVPASYITEAIRLFMQGAPDQDGLNAEKISEVRRALEVRMVEIACERATTEDVAALRATHDEMVKATDLTVVAELDVLFHRQLAGATHNVLFVVLLDSVGEILMEIRLRSLSIPGRKDSAVLEHEKVLVAVGDRDASAARAAMQSHLSTSESFYPRPDES